LPPDTIRGIASSIHDDIPLPRPDPRKSGGRRGDNSDGSTNFADEQGQQGNGTQYASAELSTKRDAAVGGYDQGRQGNGINPTGYPTPNLTANWDTASNKPSDPLASIASLDFGSPGETRAFGPPDLPNPFRYPIPNPTANGDAASNKPSGSLASIMAANEIADQLDPMNTLGRALGLGPSGAARLNRGESGSTFTPGAFGPPKLPPPWVFGLGSTAATVPAPDASARLRGARVCADPSAWFRSARA
jgi:hypothetical protein